LLLVAYAEDAGQQEADQRGARVPVWRWCSRAKIEAENLGIRHARWKKKKITLQW
jgi:hypothetical protein